MFYAIASNYSTNYMKNPFVLMWILELNYGWHIYWNYSTVIHATGDISDNNFLTKKITDFLKYVILRISGVVDINHFDTYFRIG